MTQAAAVTRYLKGEGFVGFRQDYKRQGIHVRNSVFGRVTIGVDVDGDTKTERIVQDIEQVLLAGGYDVRRNGNHLTTWKKWPEE